MIRVYLITPPEVEQFILDGDLLNNESISLLHDTTKTNIMIIAEGQEANKFAGYYMLPPYILTRKIDTLPQTKINKISQDLLDRNIITSGSITVGDLIDNILMTFNPNYKGLGIIATRDFS